jgi:hypothetical protein
MRIRARRKSVMPQGKSTLFSTSLRNLAATAGVKILRTYSWEKTIEEEPKYCQATVKGGTDSEVNVKAERLMEQLQEQGLSYSDIELMTTLEDGQRCLSFKICVSGSVLYQQCACLLQAAVRCKVARNLHGGKKVRLRRRPCVHSLHHQVTHHVTWRVHHIARFHVVCCATLHPLFSPRFCTHCVLLFGDPALYQR